MGFQIFKLECIFNFKTQTLRLQLLLINLQVNHQVWWTNTAAYTLIYDYKYLSNLGDLHNCLHVIYMDTSEKSSL